MAINPDKFFLEHRIENFGNIGIEKYVKIY